MCGIYGLTNPVENVVYSEYAKILEHRGPDGFGEYQDNSVYLAHNRLSIIDLSEKGKQPMTNEDQTLWLTFNGEIYNFQELRTELIAKGHRFHSDTDSEVIIHSYEEWGRECLQKFNGMFAFAIWDRTREALFLARDRIGIKPLYWMNQKGVFAFASESKALIKSPFYEKNINYQSLFSSLIYRYVPGKPSVWQDIYHLNPGHYLVYDLNKKSIVETKYWQIPLGTENWSEAEALDKLTELLESSIGYRLISDVPIGLFLSGGLDSTVITKYASQLSPHISTYTIGFDGSANSEADDARLVADTFATKHNEFIVGKKNIDDLMKIFYYFDEPLADSSIIPTYLVCQEAKKHATVILSGDGGDELFGGYNWYLRKYQQQLLSVIMRKLKLLPEDKREIKHYLKCTSPRCFSNQEIRNIFSKEFTDNLPAEESYRYQDFYIKDSQKYKKWQYIDAQTFMVDDVLTKVDRASMANSLEVRTPFLDHRVVEFAFSLPDNLCIKDSNKKYILKKLLGTSVDNQVIVKPKQGFECPISDYWPQSEMTKAITGGKLVREGILNKKSVSKYIKRLKGPKKLAQLWQLAAVEKWAEQWL